MRAIDGVLRRVRGVRGRGRHLAALALLWMLPALASGQTLTAADPGAPPDRTPLVLVRGLCSSDDVWNGLRATPELADRFRLYEFAYPAFAGTPGQPHAACSGPLDGDLTPERVQDLATALEAALASEPGIGPDRDVAIVAHSTGGLVARSFVQELGQARRTIVVITLATPHHGAPGVREDDAAAGRPDARAALYPDDAADAGNSWLACLDGGPGDGDACDGGDADTRGEAFAKLVAIGLARPQTLGEAIVDDGLIPLSSALFEGARPAIRRRYSGLGGQEAGSRCWGDASAHLAITHEDCLVQSEAGGPPLGVFDAIAQELAGPPSAGARTASLASDLIDFLPDLFIDTLTTSLSGVARPGQVFSVSVTTGNQGLAPSPSSTTRFYLSSDFSKSADDRLLSGTVSASAMGIGGSYFKVVSVTIPANMPLGSYNLLACADDTHVIAESNENNNCSGTGPIFLTRPDLVVQSVGNPPASVAPGGSFSIGDVTKNQSSVASAASKTRFYLSTDQTRSSGDKLLGGVHSVPVLNANGTNGATVSVTVPSGTTPAFYYVLACADDQGQNIETDEDNNCLASATTVHVGKADLVMTFVADPPITGLIGSTIHVTGFTVHNQGQGPAGSSKVRFYLSDDTVKSSNDKVLTPDIQVGAIDPGEDASGPAGGLTLDIPASTPVGTYHLIACADALGQVAEQVETNNCLATATTINVTRPDLVVTGVSTPSSTAARGTIISVTDTTMNQGLALAFPSTTRYFLSIDQAKSSGDKQLTGSRSVSFLGAGLPSTGTVNVTIPSNTTPGVYWLLACADAASAVSELNETNNCAASATQITVTP